MYKSGLYSQSVIGYCRSGDDAIPSGILDHSKSPTRTTIVSTHNENWSENATGILRRFKVENGVGVFVPGSAYSRRVLLYTLYTFQQ